MRDVPLPPSEPPSSAPPPRPSWDPRHKPCVPTVTLEGASAHHSLCALLAHADDQADLDCASSGEKVAVIEYLLAICFASGTCPSSDGEWRDWISGERSLAPAADWLRRQPDDAWDLFHPTEPLAQNSLLAEDLRESGTGTAQLVIEHAGDYNQHFDHHHLERDNPLPAAEAFRATLTQHVYAPYGRARMPGKRLGAKVTNLAVGRLAGRVRVVATGRTLGETLRLNLYPPDGPPGVLNTSWTMSGIKRRTFRETAAPRVPQSPADLHSALGRSVLLRPRQGPRGQLVVDRVLIGAGEILGLDPERHLQDAVYGQTTNGVRKPLWPSPTRALWQQAHALYSAVRDDETGLYARLRSLTRARTGPGAPYQLWAVGLLANKALPMAWTDGAYPYAPGMAAHLYRASRRGSDIAEYLAWSLKKAAIVAAETAFPAVRAADEAGQVARLDARWSFWPAAEAPFHELLDEVIDRGPEDDDPVSEPLIEYATGLMETARTQMLRRLDALPPSDRNHRARARAVRLFEDAVSGDRAPAELRGEIARD
ncbi:type I-E CRISPR-associated protein Cse1/CasA [Streptomyces tagetis]|uniref:Type I-E CRISPR-associated protein Cse1/CasA n=1 Tax=Streptomyces tagetis TaxID=2820809 RepID=A0A940XGC0_9ACTN|nr:type I-E CRISPR-associated protein Cse1/CasA [Streptomyces sp. RG38]MBQ0827880.1 type I-E CRISPR-associated protein Cse1/CasA [Streptomyces sp. RG38]